MYVLILPSSERSLHEAVLGLDSLPDEEDGVLNGLRTARDGHDALLRVGGRVSQTDLRAALTLDARYDRTT